MGINLDLKGQEAPSKKVEGKSIPSGTMVPIAQIFVCRAVAFCSWKGPGLHIFGDHSGSYIWIRVWLLFQKFAAKHLRQDREAPLQVGDLEDLAKVFLLTFQL